MQAPSLRQDRDIFTSMGAVFNVKYVFMPMKFTQILLKFDVEHFHCSLVVNVD